MKEIIHINSISEVHDVFGLDKPKHPLVSVLPIDERLNKNNLEAKSYTFGFYHINLKSGVDCSMSYGRNTYDFTEGTIGFIKPDQIVKFENPEVAEGGNGWSLIFHPDLIRKSELGRVIDNYSFFNYDVHEALHLSDDEKTSLTEIVNKIKREYQQNIDRHSQEIIIANIEMLLKYCKRYYDRQFYTRTNLNRDILSKFEEVIRNYYATDRPSIEGILSVKYCAQQFSMSPNYFGDLIKNETGKTAKNHIQDFVIDKAKTKIIGTNMAISEIAYSLGFEYPQSLNKLFKVKTGMSPKEYRMQN